MVHVEYFIASVVSVLLWVWLYMYHGIKGMLDNVMNNYNSSLSPSFHLIFPPPSLSLEVIHAQVHMDMYNITYRCK